MPVYDCPEEDCEWKTRDVPDSMATIQMQHHLTSKHTPGVGAARSTSQKVPPISRPALASGIDEEGWKLFETKWNMFKSGASIKDDQVGPQLFNCCTESLQDIIIKSQAEFSSLSEKECLIAMKHLAVIPVAVGVRRAELIKMSQEAGEPAREFHARVKGKADVCAYSTTVKCGCPTPRTVTANFTDIIIKDVVVAGLSDEDIRKDVLGWTDLDTATVADTVKFIENKEMARNAMGGEQQTVNAMSTFKRGKRSDDHKPGDKSDEEISRDLRKTAKCPGCGEIFHTFKKMGRGTRTNRTPFAKCKKCFDTEKDSEKGEVTAFSICDIQIDRDKLANNKGTRLSPRHLQIPLEHKIYDQKSTSWRDARAEDHPQVQVRIGIAEEDYRSLNMASPTATSVVTHGVADAGAQVCLFPRRDLHKLGMTRGDLFKVKRKITAANRTPITIDGAMLMRISGTSHEQATTAAMVYVSPDAGSFYLSKKVLRDLGILPKKFPNIGPSETAGVQVGQPPTNETVDVKTTRTTHGLSTEESQCKEGACTCPTRTLPPGRPSQLPFSPRRENISKMKQWVTQRYASSTLNTCPHQTLPTMDGPPIRIHVDRDAVPYRARTPAEVPLHWQSTVEEELRRDEQLGVIERVPEGEVPKFTFRMVITRKTNGQPRRTVDMSPLNRQAKREVHSVRAPFKQARTIEAKSWRTVIDAWNGYHSLVIHKDDRGLTTFITPWGVFRYVRAPQGFLSSGDGYNRRMDEILQGLERLARCTDDVCVWDDTLEAHWWRVIDLLETMGRAGIVVNPDKLQFSEETVDFAGFRVSPTSVEPLPKYLQSIQDFPRPSCITDIRSWFGLVNQAANYNQLRDLMEPFRRFLSPKNVFEWNNELDQIFEESKLAIVESIKHGVTIFDPARPTCLRPDWSVKGIGYYMSQKHCACPDVIPGCCENGWQVTLAGSRSLRSAEQRYCPLEGECLAAVWSLEQSRYFSLGCDSLKLVTDHQPLVGILGSRCLESITNARMFRLVQRTLPWVFTTNYLPGKTNWFADSLSRHPSETVTAIEINNEDEDPEIEIAALTRGHMEKRLAITWERVQEQSRTDNDMQSLINLVSTGLPTKREDMNPNHIEFWRFRDGLSVQDKVLMYRDRIVIPKALRPEIIEALHSANQGTSSMINLAQDTVFWPGLTADIEQRRRSCRTCNRIAPSQARLPPQEPEIPKTPFECMFADYADLGKSHYLITGDRLSGWIEITKIKVGSGGSGAKGLIASLREWIGRFGAPREISSDGGSEFTANETQEFLARWRIKHRRSSAYHPQSNGRAEVAVKAAKRALLDNVNTDGELNTDNMVRALLALRNTPNQGCNKSPAQIIFNRQLRGLLPISPFRDSTKFDCPDVDPLWREAWEIKERAMRERAVKSVEKLNNNCRALAKLSPGDKVFVQNQTGKNSTKWEKSGTVMMDRGHDSYDVKIDGSGRVTPRNRRFLRKFDPLTMSPPAPTTWAPPTSLPTPDNRPQTESGGESHTPFPHQALTHRQIEDQTLDNIEEGDRRMYDNVEDRQVAVDTSGQTSPKVPRALARLQSHNRQGRTEAPILPRRRVSRNQTFVP